MFLEELEMDGTFFNNQSCANQSFAFDPNIVADPRRVKQ